MKRLTSIFGCLVFLIIMMMVVSCGRNTEKETYPSNYEQMSTLIGEELASVCERLDITEEEMKLSNIGTYDIPQKVEYIGESFDMQLVFDVTDNKMYSFSYLLSFEDEPEKAAETVEKLLEQLNEVYGEADSHRGVSEWLKGQEKLSEFFNGDQTFSKIEVWDLSEKANNNIQSYMNDLKQEKGYSNVEYLMELECFYDGKTNVILSVNYYLRAYPAT